MVSGGSEVISVRARKEISGGGFAQHRIIPYPIREAVSGKSVEIENP